MKDFDIRKEVSGLPTTPGVYLMHNDVDEVIYVGKAVNLKARVSQYFHRNENRQNRIRQMIANIAWFEVIMVESELEALILESNLIKEYRPRYNAALRDDENHPYLRIDWGEAYPRIEVTTDNQRDDADYFGPFYKSMEVEKAVDFVSKYLGLRSCSRILESETAGGHPCMYYAMGQCMGPCRGDVSVEEYGRKAEMAVQFFLTSGRAGGEEFRKDLTERMREEAQQLAFERAEQYKCQIAQLDEITRKLDFTRKETAENADLLAAAGNDDEVVIALYLLRNGHLSGRDIFRLDRKKYEGYSNREVLADFAEKFYAGNPYIPPKVLLTERIGNKRALEEELSERKGSPVTCISPRTGEEGRFVRLAKSSAEQLLCERRKS